MEHNFQDLSGSGGIFQAQIDLMPDTSYYLIDASWVAYRPADTMRLATTLLLTNEHMANLWTSAQQSQRRQEPVVPSVW